MKLCKLAWAASSYLIWLQRNARVHCGSIKSEDCLIRAVGDDVRRRAGSFHNVRDSVLN